MFKYIFPCLCTYRYIVKRILLTVLRFGKIQPVADQGILKRWEGACPVAVKFLRSGDCFYATSHIPYAFVLRVGNKIYIVNIVCCLL